MVSMVPMRQLTWVSGSSAAHLLAARLQSEGIDVQLRGAVDAPYGLTVGPMARVDLYVPEDQLEDASLVMLAGEVDQVLAAPGHWADAGEARSSGHQWRWWVATVLLVTAGLAPIVVWLFDRG
jgi:hypothetical protein